jgi:outer membrane protein assembly factor BamB
MILPRMLNNSAKRRRPGAKETLWRRTATVAGVFSILTGVVMLGRYLGTDSIAPLQSPELKVLKEKLRIAPEDEQLKQQIRALDLRLRQDYFRQLSRLDSGVYLLLGGATVFIFALSRSASYQRLLPMPKPNPNAAEQSLRAAAHSRWSVAGTGLSIAVLLLALSFGLSSALTEKAQEVQKPGGSQSSPHQASNAASSEELGRNWPRFRGPQGGGIWPSNAPIEWDVKSGASVAWTIPVPAKGFNSPIIWGDQAFFSGGDVQAREVFCLELKTGKLQWRQAVTNVPGSPTQPPEIPETTGYASPSMATDGRRIYVNFANGDVAAFGMDGKLIWTKGFGPLKNPYGYATSLTTWRDRLILQLDQGEAEEGKSKLYALDGRTGQTIWQTPRKVGSSWASPIVIEAAGKTQVITLAVPWVIAYEATDGKELWRVECLNGEVTPSPVYNGGLLFVVSPSDKLLAIRPDGQGDVTKTHVAWTSEENVPDVTSPVSNGELVFTVTTAGMLTCFDAKDGKKLWEHDFDFDCHSSPSIAGDKLYIFSQKGTAVVVQVARKFQQLFRTEMGDSFHASPAFASDKMILRGTSNVWCIMSRVGNKSAK